jgi:hypothetical protein
MPAVASLPRRRSAVAGRRRHCASAPRQGRLAQRATLWRYLARALAVAVSAARPDHRPARAQGKETVAPADMVVIEAINRGRQQRRSPPESAWAAATRPALRRWPTPFGLMIFGNQHVKRAGPEARLVMWTYRTAGSLRPRCLRAYRWSQVKKHSQSFTGLIPCDGFVSNDFDIAPASPS